MLIEINENTLKQECSNCKKINEIDLTNERIELNEEFGEYSNFPVSCDCGTLEIFNMNLPLEEEEEDDENRSLVKDLIKHIRGDFKTS